MSRATVSEEFSITQEEYSRHVREYWRVAAESDGFDIDEYRSPVVLRGLVPYSCLPGIRYPYPFLVARYAMLGLHRYNILQGVHYFLCVLLKFNKTMNLTSSYYLTFLARTRDSLPHTFQVRVDEREYAILDLTVAIARFKNDLQDKDEVTPTEPFIPHFHRSAVSDGVFQGELPEWPLDDALNDDRNGFYVLNDVDWPDWISLYVELLICTTDRGMIDSDLPKLQILKVVIENEKEDQKSPDERIGARRAHVYITFKGLAKSPRLVEIGDHVECKAIFRRVIDASGYFTLQGKFWSGKDT